MKFVLPVSGLKGLQEKLDKIEHRRDIKGPCTCGRPEIARCEVCRGPACSFESISRNFALCCECWDKSAT